ncbi:MAG: alpha/beta fold hydrolase [Candidatus Deferrimicrobiaceae bacterium]
MMRATMLPGRLGTLLAVAALVYFTILLIVYLFQEKILYFPDIYPLAEAKNRARTLHFRIWPETGSGYHGFVPADLSNTRRGVILLCHGNAGTALDRFFYAKEMAHLGYPLILFEYPGYGACAGEKRESSLVSAAVEAARAAVEQFGEPLYLIGESLGCGVASAVAGSGEVPVAGVVMITPWDSLPLLAQSVYWYLPAKWLTRDQYDNVRNLKRYRGTVAVAIAENDEVIPPRHGRRLFDLLTGRKKLWVLPGAGHNNWPGVVDSEWWSEVMRFIAPQGVPGDGTRGKERED